MSHVGRLKVTLDTTKSGWTQSCEVTKKSCKWLSFRQNLYLVSLFSYNCSICLFSAWMRVNYFLLSSILCCAHFWPLLLAITGLKNWQGGTDGGTRLVILGQGFSLNQNNNGNVVLIGGKPCDVVPLHSTANQITCKTPPNPDGSHRVTVFVDGVEEAACKVWRNQCYFRNSRWLDTKISSFSPSIGGESEILHINGVFQDTASLEFNLLPTREVSKFIVKVSDESIDQCPSPQSVLSV